MADEAPDITLQTAVIPGSESTQIPAQDQQQVGSVIPGPPPDQARPVQPPGGARGGSSKPRLKLPISPGNLLLAGMLAAAGVGLYLLSLRNGPQVASAEEQANEARIEAALVQLKNTPLTELDETETVVDTFYYEASQRQIPISRISGNAFAYVPPTPTGIISPEELAGQGHSARQGHEEEPDAIRIVKQLKLQSVLMGSGEAKAIISNSLVGEGQRIQGWTVRSIKPREVLLTRGDLKYVLRMAM